MYRRALTVVHGLAQFSVSKLFAALRGAWLEPQSGAMWQENNGVTPTTTGGQTIGLLLDQSQGAVLGPELVTNGTFDTNNLTGWATISTGTGTASGSTGAAVLIGQDASNRGIISQAITTVIGNSYKLIATTTLFSGAAVLGISTISAANSSVGGMSAVAGPTTVFFVFTALSTTTYINLYTESGGGNVAIDNISVREVIGNHAYQATAANRPTYQLVNNLPLVRHDTNDTLTCSLPAINVRRNLCTNTENHTTRLGVAQGTNPPTITSAAYNGAAVEAITFPSGVGAYADSRRAGAGSGIAGLWQAVSGTTYVWSLDIAFNRALTGNEKITVYQTGAWGSPVYTFTSASSNQTNIKRIYGAPFIANASGLEGTYIYASGTLTAPITVYVTKFQAELGSVATDYQKVTDWTSEQFASSGSVYFATPVGMSALHDQSMGTSYNLPALSTDIYSWMVFPQRLSAAQETQLERYMLGKAGLATPDYLLDSSDNQLTDDSGNDIILAA